MQAFPRQRKDDRIIFEMRIIYLKRQSLYWDKALLFVMVLLMSVMVTYSNGGKDHIVSCVDLDIDCVSVAVVLQDQGDNDPREKQDGSHHDEEPG